MLPITNIALAGLAATETRLFARAQNIANMNTPGYDPLVVHQTSSSHGPVARLSGGGVDNAYSPISNSSGYMAIENKVNLAAELTDFKMAETSYKAMVAVLRTAGEMEESILEIVT